MAKKKDEEQQVENQEAEKMDPATGEIVPASEAPANAVAVPADLDSMMEAAADQGMEEVKHEDMLIPFIKVLQANSPQATRGHVDFVKGAEPGFFLCLDQIYNGESGIYFQPVKYVHQYTEWKPRTAGGGLVAQHGEEIMKVAIEQENGSYKLPNGNDLVVSSTWFGLLVNPERRAFMPAVAGLSGTQTRSARALNTAIKGLRKTVTKDGITKEFTPPAWASVFKATTALRTNDKGSWYVWSFERVGYLNEMFSGVDAKFAETLFRAAQTMYEGIQAGIIKAQEDDDRGGQPSGGGSGDTF